MREPHCEGIVLSRVQRSYFIRTRIFQSADDCYRVLFLNEDTSALLCDLFIIGQNLIHSRTRVDFQKHYPYFQAHPLYG